jgi:hypothetical protein
MRCAQVRPGWQRELQRRARTNRNGASDPLVPHCLVPKLKGKTLKAAKRALKTHFCSLGKVKHSFSTKAKKGRVISDQAAHNNDEPPQRRTAESGRG